jgi:hypothetical protein
VRKEMISPPQAQLYGPKDLHCPVAGILVTVIVNLDSLQVSTRKQWFPPDGVLS